MEFMISQMILYLVAAAVIGFSTAWFIRGRLGKQQTESIDRQLVGQRLEPRQLSQGSRFEN
jgi:hypothetical protein